MKEDRDSIFEMMGSWGKWTFPTLQQFNRNLHTVLPFNRILSIAAVIAVTEDQKYFSATSSISVEKYSNHTYQRKRIKFADEPTLQRCHRTSMAQTPLGLWKHVRDSGSASKWTRSGWLVGCLGFNVLWDSISVYIGPSPRERETEEKLDRRKIMSKQPPPTATCTIAQ